MIGYPLTKANRIKLAQAFRHVKRVDLSIDCVLEGQMGKAFVDDLERPTVFEIVTSGFFCYFAGDASGAGGRELIAKLPFYRMLMPSVPGWLELAQEIHGRQLVGLTRSSFSPIHLSLEHVGQLLASSPFSGSVKRMDAALVTQLSSSLESILDISDFDSAEDFAQRGIGCCLMDGDTLMGVAYSSLVCSKGIEVSIFVMPKYRRRGIATCLASVLLKWCLENSMEPHWDAANPESCKLAEKLGYVPVGTYVACMLQEEHIR